MLSVAAAVYSRADHAEQIAAEEVVDVRGQRELGDRDLVANRARLLLGHHRRQQAADDALRLVRRQEIMGSPVMRCQPANISDRKAGLRLLAANRITLNRIAPA